MIEIDPVINGEVYDVYYQATHGKRVMFLGTLFRMRQSRWYAVNVVTARVRREPFTHRRDAIQWLIDSLPRKSRDEVRTAMGIAA